MNDARLYDPAEWQRGLSCCECPHVFVAGEAIHSKLEAVFDDGTPVVSIVCADCALGVPA